MGKIRVTTLGDESFEKEQKAQAQKRREAKKEKKEHVKGVGLKGGQQVVAMEGVELTAEAQAAVAEIEDGKEAKKARKIKIRVRSKRYQALIGKVDKTKFYTLSEAIKLVISTANTKFVSSVDAHININPEILTKEKKTLSGSVNLPHGTGKTRKIVIADEAILDAISKGKIDFDILVAHPSMMPKLARVAKTLGPKGLMPSPKNGTVSPDPEKRVKELEGGEMTWKTESDQPIIHQTIGKVSFEEKQLEENLKTLINSVNVNKISKLTLTSSMGPGVKVDLSSL